MSESNAAFIDLRSDTVTKPTPRMRQAMAEAEVGDDVFGEDPTINRLESIVAEMAGKEAALFVSSGTMGNLIAVLSHCGRGDEIILGNKSHIHLAEQGGIAALGGVHSRTVPNQPDGTLDLQEIEESIREDNQHFPVTGLIAIENTQNQCGGRTLPLSYMNEVGDLATKHGLKLHIDGARLWNAAVALNTSTAYLLDAADSASLCLSKGLGAPVGSVVVGDQAFINQARRMRKVVGGGTRQAGVLAAAGIIAVTEMVERLADDHANAKTLAEGLAKMDGIEIEPATVETNIVYFSITCEEMDAQKLVDGLRQQNVLVSASSGRRMRAVTNHHVSGEQIETVLNAFEAVMGA